jgi:hypothetical protein
MTTPPSNVEEVQGLYGPFQFPELLLQRIWSEQTFNGRGLHTSAGETVRVKRPGRWNRQGGPDFCEAEIEINGHLSCGDVELHLREQDWTAHQHASDPAYDTVVLHVVLFPAKVQTTRGAQNRAIPILVLLPHLWHDLEEYAADAAVSAIAQRPADRLAEAWRELSSAESRARIVAEAHRRWQQKVRYARQRIGQLGWTGACHHTALEILGYRFNRAPMLATATAWPLPAWISGHIDLEQIWSDQAHAWKLSGVRPANHPRRRLAAYAEWVRGSGDWSERLAECGTGWPSLPEGLTPQTDVADLRRRLRLKSQWSSVMAAVGAAEVIKQPRADNLWGDGFLPLLAANELCPESTAFTWWFASWPGDQAANLTRAARLTGIAAGQRNPLAWGHVQGLLGQQLAAEVSAGEGDLTRVLGER